MEATRIDWTDWTDRIVALLPETDPAAIRDIGFNDEVLFDHIADRHHLTRSEAREIVFDRVLIRKPDLARMAAE